MSKNKKNQQALKALSKAVKLNPNPELYLELSFYLTRQGKPEKAVKVLCQALKNFPANKEIGSALAKYYLSQGQVQQATDLLVELHKKNPQDQDILTSLAQIYLKKKQFTKALDLLQAIPASQMEIQTHFILARAYAGTGNRSAAIEQLKQCIKLRKDFLEAWAELAYQYELAGNYVQAEKTYTALLHKGINNKNILYRLIELNLKLNNPDRALSFVQKFPKDRSFVLNAVSMFMRSGFWSQAKDLIYDLPQADLSQPNAILFRALIADQAENDPRQAITILDQLTPDVPQFFKGLTYKCQLLLKLKEYAKALQASELGIKKFPQKDDFWLLKAQILVMKKKYHQAKKIIAQALAIFPKSQKLLFESGVIEYELDHKEKALSIMEQIIQKNPEHAQALNFVGYTLVELGKDLTRAKLLISKALELDPNNGYYLDSLAWYYFKLGKVKKAWQEIKKAIAQVNDDPILWEHYGDIALALNKQKAAKQGYLNSLQHDPRDPQEIKKKIAKLPMN